VVKWRSKKVGGDSSGVDVDPNLTCPIILNQTLNATLNATLYQPAQGWGTLLDPSIILGIVQAVTALALAYLTYKLWKSTNAYSKQVEIQTNIMNDNTKLSYKNLDFLKHQANIDAKTRKYNLLREEMETLVAPLYVAYRSTQAGNHQNWGLFIPIGANARWENDLENIVQFWDKIRMNMHRSRSEEFRKSISKYLLENDNYFLYGKKSPLQHFSDARFKLLRAIMERYPELKKELDIAENEISSAETELSTLTSRM